MEFKLPKPREIYEALSRYVVGQERAKKALSVGVYNHYKRIFGHRRDEGVEIDKTNVLLVGPTGVGKTLLARTLARTLKVPFALCDATPLTEAGYVGEDVENILLRLIQAADGNVERAELGIIYLDEFDKLARRADSPSITRDVSGEGVQQALLKIIEGTTADVPPAGGRKHPEQQYLRIDTSKILFILGGAFVGLDEIMKRRTGSSIGYLSPVHSEESEITPEDLVNYGIIPEMVGRIPLVIRLDDLTEGELVRVMTEPRNSLVKQATALMEMDGVKLSLTDGALRAIARKAAASGTGARALRSILENILLETTFELPSVEGVTECVITANAVERGTKPRLVYRRKAQ